MISLINNINKVLWSNFTLAFFLGTGIFFTFKLGFIQVTKFREGMRRVLDSFSLFGKAPDNHGAISPFQALVTATASQMGSGNISGVAAAIATGGPGALFWIWVSGFFSMAIIYSEAVLAQLFRKEIGGKFVGGPAYYIRYGLKDWKFSKTLSILFSATCIISLGFIGNSVQSHSISVGFANLFHISPPIIGAVIALLAGTVFFGGIKRIVSVMEKMVPIMGGIYVLACLVIILFHLDSFGEAVHSVFFEAFTPRAAFGGAVGVSIRKAVRYGVSRGLFSNEAGIGSTSHAHAIADSVHPSQQGILAMLTIFIDTFIIVSCTAFVILISGRYREGLTGITLAQTAFHHSVGDVGTIFVTLCLFFFAFTSIISWCFFGEANLKFLFNGKGIRSYRILVMLSIFGGSFLKVGLVWELLDTSLALMLFPNLIALILLSNKVKQSATEYEKLNLSEVYPEIDDLEEEY